MFENMSKREKTLSLIVATLLPIGLLFYGFTWFMDNYEANLAELDDVQAQVDIEEDKINRAKAAAKRNAYYRKASLPSNTGRAVKVYKKWLDDLVRIEAGMTYKGVQLPRQGGSLVYGRDTVAYSKTFTVRPKGTLEQLVKFLHGFYTADHLHRINKLTIKPLSKKKRGGGDAILTGELLMEIGIETLSLVDGPDNIDSFPTWKNELPSVDESGKQILARNIFGPANNTPALDDPDSKSLKFETPEEGVDVAGEYETIKLTATDADVDNILAFELIEQSGDQDFELALSDQPNTAQQRQISLRIPKQVKPVRIPVSIRVLDNGLPAKEDQIDFTVVFSKPPPPEPKKVVPPPEPIKFAKETYIEATFRAKGQWAVVVVIPLKDARHELGMDQTLDVDGSTWKVVEINQDTVTFEVDGERHSYEPGDNLAEPLKVL